MKIRKRSRPTRNRYYGFEPLTAAQYAVLEAAQSTASGETLTSLLKDLSSNSKLQFLKFPKRSLGGLTPLEALAKGQVEKVLDVAAAFAEVSSGSSRITQELLETARDLHEHGLMSDAELHRLALLATPKPTPPMASQAEFESHKPGGPKSNITLGSVPMRVATAAQVQELMQRDFAAGKRERPDVKDGDNGN